MKTFLKHLVLQVCILGGIGPAFAAWNTLVSNGETLTETHWNDIVNKLSSLDSDLGNLSFSGGNIGIGTTNPSNTLEVIGDISADAFDLTFERVSNSITAIGDKTVTVNCNAGYTVTGGGCDTVAWGGRIVQNYPNGNGWVCSTTDTYGVAYATTVYAICVRTN